MSDGSYSLFSSARFKPPRSTTSSKPTLSNTLARTFETILATM